MEFYKSYTTVILSVVFLNVMVHILIWHVLSVDKTEKIVDNDVFQEYLIYNSKCKIPDYESYDRHFLTYIETKEYSPCGYDSVYTKIIKRNGTAFLVVRKPSQYRKIPITCCYCNVTSDSSTRPDYEIEVTACKFFKDKVRVTRGVVFVKCYKNDTVVYENVHAVILFNERTESHRLNDGEVPKRPNVLVLGLSSVSRIDFYKTFPRTYGLLKEKQWIEYTAFNVVSNETDVNLIAMLTGNLNVSSDLSDSYATDSDFIWRDFREMGYVTAYVKDSMKNGVLQNSNLGFQHPPTDFYFRDYVIATYMLYKTRVLDSIYCTGPETAVERILNVAKDFMTESRRRNTFNVFWMNGFGRKKAHTLKGLDVKFTNFFLYLQRSKILGNTVVFFLSDRGNDDIDQDTLKGWYSKQLPFLYIWIPPTLRRSYPEEYRTILENRNVLTTPFDIFLTMQDALAMYSYQHDPRKSRDCPECFSLFARNSHVRSCKEATISDEWCSCLGYKKLENRASSLAKLAEEFIIAKANGAINDRTNDTRGCSKIESKKINYIWTSDTVSSYDNEDVLNRYLKISVDTNHGIVLRGTILVSYKNGTRSFELIGALLGLDEWSVTSSCYWQNVILSFFNHPFWFYYYAV